MKVLKINNEIITASIDSHWFLSKTLFCWTDFQPRLFNFCVSFLHKGVFEIWDCSKWMDNWQSPDFSFALNSWNITSELLNLSKKADLEKGFLNLKHSDKTCKVSDICADDLQQRQPVHTVTSRHAYLIYFLMLLNWMKASVSFRGRDLGVNEKEPRLPSDPEAPAQSQILIHVLAGSSCSVADAHK